MLVLAGSGRAVKSPPVRGCGSCMVVGGSGVAIGGTSVAIAVRIGVTVGSAAALGVLVDRIPYGLVGSIRVLIIVAEKNHSARKKKTIPQAVIKSLFITHLIRLAAVSTSSLDRVVAVVVRIGFFNHALHLLWCLVFAGVWVPPDGG